jgi:AcrR family transcriptional regulator
MIGAAALAARERGAAAVSVSDVVGRAGVSRRTFYEVFADREGCLRAVLEEALARVAASVLPAWEGEVEWRLAVSAALQAFLAFLEEQPTFGMFLLVDSLGAGDWALARRAQVVDVLIDAVDAGRPLARSSDSLSRVTAEGVVGAVLAILHARLLDAGRGTTGSRPTSARSMTGMLCQLTSIVLLPYLGPAAAARQAGKSPPFTSSEPMTQAPLPGEELRDLKIRLTYRTARVVRSIAQLNGGGSCPSNREVGAHSGIADQGQISKLLSRLAGAGLVENTASRERGEPNAWRLTVKGAIVERTIRVNA